MSRSMLLCTFLVLGGSWCGRSLEQRTARNRPNIVLIVGDDVGWGDLSVYGNPAQEYGPLDRMAAEGIRFTQWYSAATFCTPSRAAMLTGRQPIRTGLYGPTGVLMPGHSFGLPHEEVTIAEALRDFGGYSTGIVGKWHLGINEAQFDDGRFLPHLHGFQYVGTILPFTLCWNCDTLKRHQKEPFRSLCFLYYNTTIVEQPIVLENLTSRIVQDAKAFIYDNQHHPFFLEVSLPQTHTPMIRNPKFFGRSKQGVYGDQVNEMSWAAGEVLDVIRELNLEQDTLVLFVSDHGPHVEICEEGGSNGPFREGKGYFGEGGLRVPAIAWWPGTIAAGQVSSDVISLLDLFPTLLEVAGIPPTVITRTLDGQNAFQSLLGNPVSPRDILYFYCDTTLVAARAGAFKIYFRQSLFPTNRQEFQFCVNGGFPTRNFMQINCPSEVLNPWLVYNVEHDPSESWPLPVEHLDPAVVNIIVNQLNSIPEGIREPLLTKRNINHSLIPCCNPPYCYCKYNDNIRQCY